MINKIISHNKRNCSCCKRFTKPTDHKRFARRARQRNNYALMKYACEISTKAPSDEITDVMTDVITDEIDNIDLIGKTMVRKIENYTCRTDNKLEFMERGRDRQWKYNMD